MVAHTTLEEFTSSAASLPTILVPRSQAIRLVELCELAEMMPTTSSGFLDFVGLGSSGNNKSATICSAADGSSNANPRVLVTQMALLLYLGEYNHARHLWRRHRRASPPSAAANSSNDDDEEGDDYYYSQLEQLWNAARYCYLWSTGGIHSLTSGNYGFSAPDNNNNTSIGIGSGSMQIENNDEEGNYCPLPFSTLALRALQSCADYSSSSSSSQKMEPLATYSAELLGVFRSRVNRAMHRSFDKLACDEFCLRMNLERKTGEGGDGDGDQEEVWNAFGWKLEEEEGGGNYLVSSDDVDAGDDSSSCVSDEEVISGGELEMDSIGRLTDVVMFLEGKMNA